MNGATPGKPAPPPAARPPRLLVEWEPWGRAFLRNLGDVLLPPRCPPLRLTSAPAPFWPDVFIAPGWPARRFLQSTLCHVFVLLAVYGLNTAWMKRPRTLPDSFFKNQTLTYYDLSEYLPAIRSGSAPAKVARKGEPEYARQPIVSLPLVPDNSTQTIINPLRPDLIPYEVKLPNMVVQTNIPAPPVAAAARSGALFAPVIPVAVVQPPAENQPRNLADLKLPRMPQPAIIEPPPTDAGERKLGDLNIGAFAPSVEAPALPVAEQRTGPAGAEDGDPVPPPPSAVGAGGSGVEAAGQFIALSVRPAMPSGPLELPPGSRRGIFAAGPEGRPGAPGTPDIAGGGDGAGGTGAGSGGPGSGRGDGNPAGIYVGGSPAPPGPVAVVAAPAPKPAGPPVSGSALKNALMAAARPFRTTDIPREATSSIPRPSAGGKIEDEVFGPKKFYSMTINMPNLTSAGGSWILRFAELHQTAIAGELTAPVATSKVDPAYPPDLIKARVEGTVFLYAVIRADGRVGEIRVLRGLDERLDENARIALSRWVFRPATKNGAAVDLEAVVAIPFAVGRRPF